MTRLPHGYTNETSRTGKTVTKQYTGRDAEARLAHEVAALQTLENVLPLPTILGYDRSRKVLQTRYLSGRHGQELIDEGHASTVLYVCGTLLQRLQTVPPDLLRGTVPGSGSVIVHGDFGPQNLLINPDEWTATGLLDWEWVHLGDAIEDLAWAEWIVRTHHPTTVASLSALFEGYGSTPTWAVRHAAMLAKCRFLLDYSQTNNNEGAVALWEARLQRTAQYEEVSEE